MTTERERERRFGPHIAGLAVVVGIALFVSVLGYSFARQHTLNVRLCQQTVANRDAIRGVWQGARRLILAQTRSPIERERTNAFFDEILKPYPQLECHGATAKRITAGVETAGIELELVSYSPDDLVPCIPLIPGTCPPPPSSPPSGKPPRGDDPPQMVAVFIDSRTRRTVRLGWETAQDEEGIVAYRIYRDSKRRATAGARARRARVWLPCGLHIYAVEAVDTSGQADALSIGVRRRC